MMLSQTKDVTIKLLGIKTLHSITQMVFNGTLIGVKQPKNIWNYLKNWMLKGYLKNTTQ